MSPNGWTPADEIAAEEWTRLVNAQIVTAIADHGLGEPGHSPLYNPATEDVSADQIFVPWQAFPGTIDKQVHLPPEERWKEAEKRGAQDEYCEWHSELNDQDELMRVTFTTEVPEYFEALHRVNSDAVLALYRDWVGEHVEPEEIAAPDGTYDRDNVHRQSQAAIVHLQGAFNTLSAAVQLAAQAVIVRHDEEGNEITDLAELVACNGMGDPSRNSDPQIAATINGAAAGGARIALSNPIGPFVEKLRMEQMELDDSSLDLADFWQPERRMGNHVVRASFAAPDGSTPLSRVRLEGEPLRSGAQLAQRVNVQLGALVAQAGVQPVEGPCKGG